MLLTSFGCFFSLYWLVILAENEYFNFNDAIKTEEKVFKG
jgi:hypothetical protein